MTECRNRVTRHQWRTVGDCRSNGGQCCSVNQNGIPAVDTWGATAHTDDACANCFWGIKQTPAPTSPTEAPTAAPSYRFTKECGGGEMVTAGDSDVYDAWVHKIKNNGKDPKTAADKTDHLTVGDYQPNYKVDRATLELKPYGGGDTHGRILVGYNTVKKIVRAKCYNRHAGNTIQLRQIMEPMADAANAHYIDYGDYGDYGNYGNYDQQESQAAHVYHEVDRVVLPYDYDTYDYGTYNNYGVHNYALILSLIILCLIIPIIFICGSIFGYGSTKTCEYFTKNKQNQSLEID